MHLRVVFILLLSVGFSMSVQAQWRSERCKWIHLFNQSFELDTLTLQPGSIKLIRNADTAVSVYCDNNKNHITITAPHLHSFIDSVLICYKVFPFNLSKKIYRRKFSEYDTVYTFDSHIFSSSFPEKREQLLSTPGIQKTGSITRGISLGNTQTIFVNSALNLQLEGKLNDDITIVAALSDQNIPFQPEGNTQQLQELDRVFIQLKSRYATLTVGDVVLKNQPSQFLRYYKNVQGAFAEVSYKRTDSVYSTTSVGASLSKGKFASIVLSSLEGVQGPYRLKGPQNELFVMVLANSERVFVDGKLLQRGFNLDYVIDYNQAEITFTNRILITQFSRIRVDFEYVERNYNRTIFTASHYHHIHRFSFFGNIYSQRDMPSSPLGITLTDADKLFLQTIGDSSRLAVSSGVTEVGFYPDRVLYKQVDSLTDEGLVKIYVYSIDSQKSIYQIVFSEVGLGKGNYSIASSTANGRVYKWIAPKNGIPQGSYEPVKQIPLPQKNEMYTFGGEYALASHHSVFMEGAISQYDINLYSHLNDEDNIGKAIKVGYQNKGDPIQGLKNYRWVAAVDYEFDDRYFRPIDRFRYIEFDRDWSANSSLATPGSERIFNTSIGIEKNPFNKLSYVFSKRFRGDQFNGYQHRAEWNQELGLFFLQSSFFNMVSENVTSFSHWNRFQSTCGIKLRSFTAGYLFSLDKNEIRKIGTDSVIATVMNFDEHQLFIKNSDSASIQFHAKHSFRYDYLPIDGFSKRASRSHTTEIGFEKSSSTNQLAFNFTYRDLKSLLLDTDKRIEGEQTLMGRVDWNAYWFQRAIRSELTFFTFTGRELKRAFVYLPVAIGKGTHTWRDDNKDGIQDLNEFYEAINPDEKMYVKIAIPTNEYVSAYGSNMTYRLTLGAPTTWYHQSYIKRMVARFSNASSWAVEKKTTSLDFSKRFIPIDNLADEELLAIRETIRSTLFYNRTNSGYGSDFSVFFAHQKNLLTNGFESKQNREYKWNTRVNLTPVTNLKLLLSQSDVISTSNFLLTKNFSFRSYKVSPELAWQPYSSFRITGVYGYSQKLSLSHEHALFNEFGMDLRWSKISQKTVTALLRWVSIVYEGETNTPVSYELLEALQPGKNITWSINWIQRLVNGLQLTFSYEGRRSANQPAVHIGRMQISALF
jgi:hypothetical protein